jgi:putative lipase involved disintegration of autophagic bodies
MLLMMLWCANTSAALQATQSRLLLTGHSAGALTAELLAAEWDIPAITFDSPGKF